MACQCNHSNLLEETLDVTTIPHSVRHPAILGAISALPVKGTLLLKAPHMPNPLLGEMQDLEGEFGHEVVQDGPSEWVVRICREG
ncbi:DUF2249 domain-containing protein [Flaviflexus salsibiostraticola]|uniref:DUF2249 domain-containing protein n=1 Tax=Flaviflexus salsibiostraticola TaxID=1282737 RepID=A0A3S8ZAZ8_9ACTO|nr:DUF2249 domain-containing protein [Flaviflexus salsibiostraticola]AZN30654.1 DUF2249 domain-containing protein [Flaviflexus salsibiostraticola]